MGAWTGQIFPSWAPHLRPIRQFQAWVQVDIHYADLYSYENMPTWVMVPPHYPLALYGVPCDVDDTDGCQQWIKVGIHGRDHYVPDPSTNPVHVSEEERAEVLESFRHVMPVDRISKQLKLAAVKPCFYTMTADTHFMLGTPDGHDQVFCVAGLSGHGYKQAPALGQMMVDFALGNDMSKWNLDFCDPQRFGV